MLYNFLHNFKGGRSAPGLRPLLRVILPSSNRRLAEGWPKAGTRLITASVAS